MNILGGHIKETETSHGSISDEEKGQYIDTGHIEISQLTKEQGLSDASVEFEEPILAMNILSGHIKEFGTSHGSISDEEKGQYIDTAYIKIS